MNRQHKKKKILATRKPVVFRGRCRECDAFPVKLIMGLCAKCRKLAKEKVRIVTAEIALRESRTITDQVKAEKLLGHSLTKGKIMEK